MNIIYYVLIYKQLIYNVLCIFYCVIFSALIQDLRIFSQPVTRRSIPQKCSMNSTARPGI
jgi:hypothetical protein